MNLPIVPFDVARDLKELGFDWDVLNKYADNGKLNDATYSGDIKAPTQSEVCKWLRDEKGIHIEITIMNYLYAYEVCDTNGLAVVYFGNDMYKFDTYEAAELAGIKKAIEILKERNNMKLTLEHLAPYLPYNVQMRGKVKGRRVVLNSATLPYAENGLYTLILHPLSDLTDEKIDEFNLDITDVIELREVHNHYKIATHLDYNLCQILFKHHFDIFRLIDKGLAIDINTLNL